MVISLITFALRKNIFPFRLEESLISYMFFGAGYFYKNIIDIVLCLRTKMNVLFIVIGTGAVLPMFIFNIPTTEANVSLWGAYIWQISDIVYSKWIWRFFSYHLFV